MILFGSHFSPFVRKVLVYAAEKGIELEVRNIGLGSDDPDFKAASPLGKMPGFQDGDFRISDSTAIITYLEAKQPTPSLTPASPEDRARAVWFEEFADTVMSMVVFKCFFNRIVAPIFLKQEGNEALAVEGETKDLPPLLDYLESVVPMPAASCAATASAWRTSLSPPCSSIMTMRIARWTRAPGRAPMRGWTRFSPARPLQPGWRGNGRFWGGKAYCSALQVVLRGPQKISGKSTGPANSRKRAMA